jgi:hypothetical protein
MKRNVIGASAFWLGAIGMGAISTAQASPGKAAYDCVARVLHSEQLPYAPIGYWLAKVTLQVTPPDGPSFIRTFYDNVPLRSSSPRPGETFGLRCASTDGLLH